MAKDQAMKVALLWRGDRETRDRKFSRNSRLFQVHEALSALNIRVEKAVYSEEFEEEVREQLLRVDGVLVWVDPIMGDRDRTRLDAMLRTVADKLEIIIKEIQAELMRSRTLNLLLPL